MVKTKMEILESLKNKFGDDTGDETISIIEDISDTLDDYEKKTADNTNWETKFKENDEAWRKKYTDRFYSASEDAHDDDKVKQLEEQAGEDVEIKTTYEDLFKEED
jgi:thiamine pyrophosphate-dependent acetolactate synthase large subunit-like protein